MIEGRDPLPGRDVVGEDILCIHLTWAASRDSRRTRFGETTSGVDNVVDDYLTPQPPTVSAVGLPTWQINVVVFTATG